MTWIFPEIDRNSWCSGKILYCPESQKSEFDQDLKIWMHSDDVYPDIPDGSVVCCYCYHLILRNGWIISYPGRTRTPTCWFVESTSQVQSRQYSRMASNLTLLTCWWDADAQVLCRWHADIWRVGVNIGNLCRNFFVSSFGHAKDELDLCNIPSSLSGTSEWY